MSWIDLTAGTMWLAASVAIWAALSASRNVSVAGRRSFMWLQAAIAIWAITAGVEALNRDARVLLWISQVQYLGIVSLPVFWFRFAGAYTHRLDLRKRWLAAFWLVPFITLAAAFTNDTHHLLWRNIIPSQSPDQLTTYIHGPIFWLNWVHAYVLIAIATAWLALSLPHYRGRYRVQLWLLILGVAAPWIGNAMYILGWTPIAGLDMTPLAFALTGVCFVASVFSGRRS